MRRMNLKYGRIKQFEMRYIASKIREFGVCVCVEKGIKGEHLSVQSLAYKCRKTPHR